MAPRCSSWLLAASPSNQPNVGYGTLAALVLFIIASMWIGMIANKAMQSGSFMKGFFLGNRGLGAWALALTATVQSGGTFMGFPSLVYTHGWIVALWICSYMVVPITGFGVLGKRLAQLSRKTGALTVPDIFRARFNSPSLGLTASLFIMFYMSFMMVAQFKAGALVMKLAWPGSGLLALTEEVSGSGGLGTAYYIGLGVFTLTVVSYTLLGGFLAAVWTDLFQSVMMLVGVMILLVLALQHAGGMEQATRQAVENTDPATAAYAFGPGYDDPKVNPPNPQGPAKPMAFDKDRPREFMPLGLAVSFFFVWVYSGFGSPAGMVRIMAGKSTGVIRRSIYLLSGYNLLIYIPLIIICICGRAMIPGLGDKTDEIIPQMALRTTQDLPGGSFLAGLILAAPFGAVMATVSSYLVVIASGLVRDVYQRFINPHAGTHDLRRLSYLAMIAVGAIAVLANIDPPRYLQAVVVFSGTGTAATFCVPALMLAYWRRATERGMLASMITGAATVMSLYVVGFLGLAGEQRIGQFTGFRPYFLLDLDPLLWGLAVSLVSGIAVSLCTAPPEADLVSRLFDAEQKPAS
ncbi:MAG TPA: sodium:solute symporter [Planctomycetaceae bacterium]|jgi:SSS family solute:Na+ symporter/sodium/pantothenate symporter